MRKKESSRIQLNLSTIKEALNLPSVYLLLALSALMAIAGCNSNPPKVVAEIPTLAVAIATPLPDTPTPTPDNSLPPTFTPESQTIITPTPVGEFVVTPKPTNTPFPTPVPTKTRTPFPTKTPFPTNTPPPTLVPTQVPTSIVPTTVASIPSGTNLLFNPSFEMGFTNPNGVIELQIPDLWNFEYDIGYNPLDPEDWNRWVRPEVRVLSKADIPSHEHNDFFVDSNQTVKIFKGYGSVSYRLTQNLKLDPGRYQFTIHVFPDMVDDYLTSGKVYADDYRAAEISFLVNGVQSDWRFVPIGQKNRYGHVFEVNSTQTVQIGLAARGRWAHENNGWFVDGFSLVQIDD
ncbi:MAG: hypothetical protein AB8G95_19000 [Anaerolineae bacterium]